MKPVTLQGTESIRSAVCMEFLGKEEALCKAVEITVFNSIMWPHFHIHGHGNATPTLGLSCNSNHPLIDCKHKWVGNVIG